VEASRRIDLQQSILSGDSLLKYSDQDDEISRVAYRLGWTHLLLKKNWNSKDTKTLMARLPLRMTFENEKYVVFAF